MISGSPGFPLSFHAAPRRSAKGATVSGEPPVVQPIPQRMIRSIVCSLVPFLGAFGPREERAAFDAGHEVGQTHPYLHVLSPE
jgi:hypothetical protein